MYDAIHEGFFAGATDGLRLVLAVVLGITLPMLLFSPWLWMIAIPYGLFWVAREWRRRGAAPPPTEDRVRRGIAPATLEVLGEITAEDIAALRQRERRLETIDLGEQAPMVVYVTGIDGSSAGYSRSDGRESSGGIEWSGWVWRSE